MGGEEALYRCGVGHQPEDAEAVKGGDQGIIKRETLGEGDSSIPLPFPIPPPPPTFLLRVSQASFLLEPHPEYPHEWNPAKHLPLPGFLP